MDRVPLLEPLRSVRRRCSRLPRSAGSSAPPGPAISRLPWPGACGGDDSMLGKPAEERDEPLPCVSVGTRVCGAVPPAPRRASRRSREPPGGPSPRAFLCPARLRRRHAWPSALVPVPGPGSGATAASAPRLPRRNSASSAAPSRWPHACGYAFQT